MNQSEIVQIVKDLLQASGYSYDDIELREEPVMESLIINIRTPDARRLIGRNGDVIRALNHLVHAIAETRMATDAELPKFSLDVDNYFANHLEHLKSKARMMADRARSLKSDMELEPMSSFERLIIHNILASSPDIKTESTGDGESRRVVIKYSPSEDDLGSLKL